MPKKPRINHPVRQVRTCLGLSQPQFAKLVGCSAIAIQRIENGSLALSGKLAHAIAEATNADPFTLLKGDGVNALDGMGRPYTKNSLHSLKALVPITDKELQHYLHAHFRYLELLLIASRRAGKFKTHGVIAAIQDAYKKIARDFDLTPSIHSFLIEKGSFLKHKYRVADLRKFPDYARILGFKDNRNYRPDRLFEFTIPMGWIQDYLLVVSPVLPHGADRKLLDANYILDSERPTPDIIKEAVAQALYWEIKSFQLTPDAAQTP